MAVTKTVTRAVPHELDGKVVTWALAITYEDGEEDTYYTSTFNTTVDSRGISDEMGNREEVFEEKAKGEWTLAEITALMPLDKWDNVFALQYDSVITNPPVVSKSDKSFELPIT